MIDGSQDYSDEEAYRVAYLITGFIRKTLTVPEHDELDAWVEASDENMRLFEDLTDENNIEANLAWMENIQTEKNLKKTMAQLSFEPEYRFKKQRSWWPYPAAASAVLVIATLFLFKTAPSPAPGLADQSHLQNDVMPGGNRATLTLGDGKIIDLTKAGIGILKKEKGVTIEKKQDGKLMYSKLNDARALTFNTLSTPKGGQYSLMLSDGTKVWLNAMSSLRYPVQFGDSTRVVELAGEGYFEVAKDKIHPFIVRLAPEEEIKVLGTQFNVMAYPGEAAKMVTLIEGSVNIASENSHLNLKPGQQAVLNKTSLFLDSNPDTDAATGWIRGEFAFSDADINDIMRQVERWYDVNVIYKTNASDHFNATLSRNEPVSKLLHYLELTGRIHFKIENKTIYVLP